MHPPLPTTKYPKPRSVLHLTLRRIVNEISFFIKKFFLLKLAWLYLIDILISDSLTQDILSVSIFVIFFKSTSKRRKTRKNNQVMFYNSVSCAFKSVSVSPIFSNLIFTKNCSKLNKKIIDVQLIYNVVLVSGVWQSFIYMNTYVYFIFQILFPYMLVLSH